MYDTQASKALVEYEGINNLALSVGAEIDEFKPLMPIITALRNPGLRERHWDQVEILTRQFCRDFMQTKYREADS